MIVKCEALVCENNRYGICIAEVIKIADIEEKENIKDEDFAVCKSFKGVY